MMPFMFFNKTNQTFVVIQSSYFDWVAYNTKWMDNPSLPETDEILIPEVDITKELWIFDQGPVTQRHKDALMKMKELWSKVDFGTPAHQ